ncbi:MAG: hypothetical protein ACOCVC_09580 [Spirochaeta sp.]
MNQRETGLIDIFISIVRHRRRILVLWIPLLVVGLLAALLPALLQQDTDEADAGLITTERSIQLVAIVPEIDNISGFNVFEAAGALLHDHTFVESAYREARVVYEESPSSIELESFSDMMELSQYSVSTHAERQTLVVRHTGGASEFSNLFLEILEDNLEAELFEVMRAALQGTEHRVSVLLELITAYDADLAEAGASAIQYSSSRSYPEEAGNDMPLAIRIALALVLSLGLALAAVFVSQGVRRLRNDPSIRQRLSDAVADGRRKM